MTIRFLRWVHYGAYASISYKKRKIRKPQDEWFRVENTYEEIISKEVLK